MTGHFVERIFRTAWENQRDWKKGQQKQERLDNGPGQESQDFRRLKTETLVFNHRKPPFPNETI